jgi:hypothetical protein
MQNTFDKAVEMFRRGRSLFDVAQELGASDVIDDAEQFVVEEIQKAANTAVAMLKEGARQSEVIKALQELGLRLYDADEITLHAMAAVRREKANVADTK